MRCRDKQDKVLAIISLDSASNERAKEHAWSELGPETLFREVAVLMLEAEQDPMRTLIEVDETTESLPSPPGYRTGQMATRQHAGTELSSTTWI